MEAEYHHQPTWEWNRRTKLVRDVCYVVDRFRCSPEDAGATALQIAEMTDWCCRCRCDRNMVDEANTARYGRQ